MQKKEPDFCLLYAENKKCHEMKILNCYLCACPHFRFNDKGFHQERTEKERPKTVFSFCEIESKHGARFLSEKAIHHDCTGCKIPHNEGYIKKHFSRNWFEIMQKVSAKNDLILS